MKVMRRIVKDFNFEDGVAVYVDAIYDDYNGWTYVAKVFVRGLPVSKTEKDLNMDFYDNPDKWVSDLVNAAIENAIAKVNDFLVSLNGARSIHAKP